MTALRRACLWIGVAVACFLSGPGCLAGTKGSSASGAGDERIGEFLLHWIERRRNVRFEGDLGAPRPIKPLEKNGESKGTGPAGRILHLSVADRTLSVPESTEDILFHINRIEPRGGTMILRGRGWMFERTLPGPALCDYMHDSVALGTAKTVTPGLIAAGIESDKSKRACAQAEAELARLSEESLLLEFVGWDAAALKKQADPVEAAKLTSIGRGRASGVLGPGAVRYVKRGSQTVYIVPETAAGPPEERQYLLLAYDKRGAIAWDANMVFFEEFQGGKQAENAIIRQLIGRPYQYHEDNGAERKQPVDAQGQ